MEMSAPAMMRLSPWAGRRPSERASADLGEARRDEEGRVGGAAEELHDPVRGRRLPDHDDEDDGQHLERLLHDDARVEQHADRDEEEHREGVLQRQRVLRGLLAQVGRVDDHAGEEGAEREGDAEQGRRAEGDAERHGEHGKGEQLARSGARDARQQPGHADDEHQRDEQDHLPEREREGDAEAMVSAAGARCRAAERLGERGEQHENDDRHEVLDHQPADRNSAVSGIEDPAILERAEEHDGARDGEAEPEDEARAPRPAEQVRHHGAEQGGDRDLHERAGEGNAPHGEQVADGEVDPDAEHEQDDADLRELLRQSGVDDDARCVGADDDAGEEVPDEGGHPQPDGEEPEQEGQAQAGGDRGDQCGLVGHALVDGVRSRWTSGEVVRRTEPRNA